MRRKHKLKSVKNKSNKPKVRLPNAPPSIRHEANRVTGYNRLKEKKEFLRHLLTAMKSIKE